MDIQHGHALQPQLQYRPVLQRNICIDLYRNLAQSCNRLARYTTHTRVPVHLSAQGSCSVTGILREINIAICSIAIIMLKFSIPAARPERTGLLQGHDDSTVVVRVNVYVLEHYSSRFSHSEGLADYVCRQTNNKHEK